MAKFASFALAFANLSNAIKILDQHDKWLNANTPNLLALEVIANASAIGDFATDQGNSVDGFRASIVGVLSSGSVSGYLSPFVDDVHSFIEGVATSFGGKLVEIRDYMVANSKTVEERVLTVAAINPDGSNVGDNEMYALAVDRHNKPLQSATVEAVKFECKQDSGNGSRKNNELFKYIGTTASKDDAAVAGTGLNTDISVSYDSENILRNSRFSSFNGTVPTAGVPTVAPNTTAFASWTLDTAASFKASVDNVTRIAQNQTSAKALRLAAAAANVNQRLFIGGFDFNVERPYLPAALIHRANAVTGNIVLSWGSKNQTFTVASLTNNDYTWIVADRDQDLYYDNWKQEDPLIDVAFNTLSVPDDVQVIEVGFFPGLLINGFWWWLLGGDTPALREDFFTTTLAQTADGINQRWISQRTSISGSLGYPFSLASATVPTEADA
jgi:hypothetical protein